MPDPPKNGHRSDRIHQATGMIAAHADGIVSVPHARLADGPHGYGKPAMGGGSSYEDLTPHVLRAVEMVAAQAECDSTEALDRLIVRAAMSEQSLEHMALDVLDGIFRFDEYAG